MKGKEQLTLPTPTFPSNFYVWTGKRRSKRRAMKYCNRSLTMKFQSIKPVAWIIV